MLATVRAAVRFRLMNAEDLEKKVKKAQQGRLLESWGTSR